MEIRQITNLLKIAETGNISRAAESLYITQSALNRQLLKLEQELEVELFHRHPHGVTPTYAGRIYLDNARKILEIKNETYKILQDISDNQRGEISVAFSPFSGMQIFTKIYPVFHKQYPQIEIKLHEIYAVGMPELLESRQIAFAMMSYTEEDSRFDYHYVTQDTLLAAVPITHPLARFANNCSSDEYPILDLHLLENEPVLMPQRNTHLRRMLEEEFAAVGLKPRILLEISSVDNLVRMVEEQVAVGFHNAFFAHRDAPVVYFRLPGRSTRNLAILTYKGAYLTRAELNFLQLCGEEMQRIFTCLY